MFYPNSCYIRKCNMSGRMLHTKICIVSKLCHIRKCIMSEPMLHTEYDVACQNLCYIWQCVMYVTRECEMCSVRMYVAYENVICPNHGPNLCYERKYDVLCPILCCIRKCVMSEHKLHTNMKCVLFQLMVHTKNLRPSLCYTRKYDVFSPKCYIRQFYMSETMLPTTMYFVRTYVTYDNM